MLWASTSTAICAFSLLFLANNNVRLVSALSLTYKFKSFEPPACFQMDVSDPAQKIQFYFNVHENAVAEAGSEVDFTITGPNSQQLHAQQKVPHADITVQPMSSGVHSICLRHNGPATDKVIDLDFSLSKAPSAAPVSGSSELKPAPPTANLERTNTRVKQDLTDLYHTLRYINQREKNNFHTVTSIKFIVKWFSVFQCFTVIALGFAQVYVLKTFFSASAKPRV